MDQPVKKTTTIRKLMMNDQLTANCAFNDEFYNGRAKFHVRVSIII